MLVMSDINEVWMVSREMDGLAGVGGVKDVTRQLLAAIARHGIRANLVMPLYSFIDLQGCQLIDAGIQLSLPLNYTSKERRTPVRIHRTEQVGAAVYLVEAACYDAKEGIYTYTEAEAERAGRPELAGSGYYDFFEMNVTLQKAALELIQALGARPDVIHCQDGHTALIPALMRSVPRYRSYFEQVGTGITIHNAGPGYNQEVYDVPFAQAITELPQPVIQCGLHRGAVYPFLVGGLYADFINAVSENYAQEIMEIPAEDERTGGIGSAFRQRGIRLTGVTNGIDPAEYDPTQPERMGIVAAYDPAHGDLAGKVTCRGHLISCVNQRLTPGVHIEGYLEDGPDRPLIAMISRLTAQKGVDRFIGAVRQLLEGVPQQRPPEPDALFMVLGTGDPIYQDALIELARTPRFAGRMAVAIGYGPHLANCIYAAGDFFVNPAEFEPCGLTDYIAQLMGTVPVVHLVGGLVKVQDGVTGYGYIPHTAQALAATLRRAMAVFHQHPDQHLRIVQQAIRTIHERYTWDKVLQQGYMPLYQQASGRHKKERETL
jgi:starch synthase